jgi:hypothetical protein
MNTLLVLFYCFAGMYWREWERLLVMLIGAKLKNAPKNKFAHSPKSLKGERRWKRGADPRGKHQKIKTGNCLFRT